MDTIGLEFESGRAPFVRAWDSRSFTHSPEPIKCAFQGVRFPRIQKKKSIYVDRLFKLRFWILVI